MAKDVNAVQTDIDAELEAATEEDSTEESSTEESETEEVEEEEEKSSKSKKNTAQDRIRELVSLKKQLEEEVQNVKKTLAERDDEIGKLVDLVQSKENDSKVIQRINELYESDNPELKEMIETLDKAIKGEEVNIKKEESKGNDTEELQSLKQMLEKTKEELESNLSEQRAEQLLDKADSLTDHYFGQLPEQYGDEDKRILREAIVDRIDWDAIEEDPNVLNEKIAEGVKKTLDWYGKPKGVVEESSTKGKEAPRKEFTQEQLDKFVNQEWGRLKQTEKGKVPEVSDEEWEKALGASLRRANEI